MGSNCVRCRGKGGGGLQGQRETERESDSVMGRRNERGNGEC